MCDGWRGDPTAHLECVARLGPEQLTAEDAFHAAVSHRARGDAPSAADWYGRAVRLRPSFAEAYLNGAFVLSEAGRTADAIESYQAGLSLREWPAETAGAAYNNLGVLLRDSGRHDEAVASFEKAVRARPDLREASDNLQIARAGPLPLSGGAFYHLIRQANQKFAEAIGGRASGFGEAAELYKKATGLRNPRLDGSAYVGLGAALHGARRVEEALEVRVARPLFLVWAVVAVFPPSSLSLLLFIS
jgi:tetratricopeptide (TPR) repeat protein